MLKSVRVFVIVAVLTATISLSAEQTACNPRPQAATVPATMSQVVSAVMSYLGF